jgi:parallel beta-helix repeat protein
MLRSFFALLFLLTVCGEARTALIHVPDDYPTIQAAIDGSANGDLVIVRPGTYVENISFLGKMIMVGSEMGPAVTVIDGNQAGCVVEFSKGESAASVIDGFTITNGSSIDQGGGICVRDYSSPTVVNNVITGNRSDLGGGICCIGYSTKPVIVRNTITGNTAFSHGGGIYCELNDEMTIMENRINGNVAGWYGGGIYCCNSALPLITDNMIAGNRTDWGDGAGIACRYQASATITNNTITGNRTDWWGGGIYCEDSSPTLISNTVTANAAGLYGGGLCCYFSASPTIINTILWGNSAPHGRGINAFPTCVPVVTYSNVEGGWAGTGNIDADPLFSGPGLNDFHLTFSSPCREAGDNTAVQQTLSADFEGDPRIAGGTTDIGADEFFTHLYSLGAIVPGNRILINTVGAPASPVTLLLGSGVLWIPHNTPHGKLHLNWPLLWQGVVGTIPSDGVLFVSVNVPSAWQTSEEHPLQALVGPWGSPGTLLTNLMILTVE